MIINFIAILSLRFPLLIATFVAPYFLSADDFGQFILMLSITTFLSILVNANIAVGFGRAIYDDFVLSELFKSATAFVAVSHASALFILVLIFYIFDLSVVSLVVLVVSATWSIDIILHQLSIRLKKTKNFVGYMAIKYLALLSFCVLVSSSFDWRFDRAFWVFEGVVIPILMAATFLVKTTTFRFKQLYLLKHMRGMLRFSSPMLVYNLSLISISQADRFVLKFFYGSSIVGVYSYFYSLASILNLVVVSYLNSKLVKFFEARSSQSHPQDKVYIKLHGLQFITGSFAIVLSTFMIDYIPREMRDHLDFLSYSLSALAYSIVFQQACRELAYQKKTKSLLLISLLGALINVGLNFILVPAWGAKGALLATGLTYLILSVLSNKVAYSHSSFLPMKILLMFSVSIFLSLIGYIFALYNF